MFEDLPDAVLRGFEEAKRASVKRSSRLCVHDGDKVYRLRRLWESGFSVDAQDAPNLRGHVQIYDGPRQLYQALVVTSSEEGDERVFEFKWMTPVSDGPAADFERPDDRPVGFLSGPDR